MKRVVSIEGINISDKLDKAIRNLLDYKDKGDVYLVKVDLKSQPLAIETLKGLMTVLETILDTDKILIIPKDMDISITSVKVEEVENEHR